MRLKASQRFICQSLNRLFSAAFAVSNKPPVLLLLTALEPIQVNLMSLPCVYCLLFTSKSGHRICVLVLTLLR